jgi:hypothetical protein
MPVASSLSSKRNENMHGKIVIKYLYDHYHGHLKSELTKKDPPNGPVISANPGNIKAALKRAAFLSAWSRMRPWKPTDNERANKDGN